MDKDIIEKNLKELAKTAQGKAMRAWIDEEIIHMCDLEKNPPKDHTETLGREQAIKILRRLFNFLNESQVKDFERDKNQYQ